jgi:hypothetical protein
LTQNTHRQPSAPASTPPRKNPLMPPAAAAAVQTPRARARSGPLGKVVVSSDSAAGTAIAAPSPWRARAPSSIAGALARPQASEATVNSASPMANSRRRPYRSAARPASNNKPPKHSA